MTAVGGRRWCKGRNWRRRRKGKLEMEVEGVKHSWGGGGEEGGAPEKEGEEDERKESEGVNGEKFGFQMI